MVEEPRRSKRVRKRLESIYDLARVEHAEAHAAEDDEAANMEEEEEEEEFQVEMKDSRPKQRQSRAARKRTRRRAASPEGAPAESVATNALWEATVGGQKRAIEAAAEALVEDFSSRAGSACARAVEFVLLCSGASDVSFVGESVDMPGKREWAAWFSKLGDQLRTNKKRRRGEAQIRKQQAFVWRSVARACGGRTPALATCADVLAAASTADVGPARLAATAGAMAVGAAAAELAEAAAQSLATAERQLASAAGASKRAAVEAQAATKRGDLASLEGVVERIEKAVVGQRYRDARPAVRAACAEGLADWMRARPEVLVQPRLVKYLGWMLDFRDASDRIAACSGFSAALEREPAGRLKEVVAALAPRLAEMARADVDRGVRTAAMAALVAAAGAHGDEWDDATAEAVSAEARAALLDPAADDRMRRSALEVAFSVEGFEGDASSPPRFLFEVATFVADGVLPSDEPVRAGAVDLVAGALLHEDDASAEALRDWSAYVDVLGRDDVDAGARRRPVAVMVGLLAAAARRAPEGLEALEGSLPALLAKFALGETSEIAGPLVTVAGLAPAVDETVRLVVRCLSASSDAAVVRAAAEALALVDATGPQQALLDAALAEAVRAAGDDSPGAVSRLANVVAGGLDLPAARGLARSLADRVETDATEVVDALSVLSALAASATRRALAARTGLEGKNDDGDDDSEALDEDVEAPARSLARAAAAVLSMGEAPAQTRLRAAEAAVEAVEAGDRRLILYEGLEHLALSADDDANLGGLVVDFCRGGHTLEPLVRLGLVGLRRSRRFHTDDDDLGAAADALAFATIGGDHDILRNACDRLQGALDPQLRRDRLTLAELHVEAFRRLADGAPDGDALRDYAADLARASRLDTPRLSNVVAVAARLGLEALPRSAVLLAAAEPYVRLLAARKDAADLDLATLLDDLENAKERSADSRDALQAFEDALRRLDRREQPKRPAARREQPRVDLHEDDEDTPESPPAFDAPIKDVSNFRPPKRRHSYSSVGSKKSRVSQSSLEKIDEALDEEDAEPSRPLPGVIDECLSPPDDDSLTATRRSMPDDLSPTPAHRRAEDSSQQLPDDSPAPASRRTDDFSQQLPDDSPAPASRRSVLLSESTPPPADDIFSSDDEEPFPAPRSRPSDITN